MAHSKGHAAHCLGRILAIRRNAAAVVDVSGSRRRHRTGGEFVHSVWRLAGGLMESGVRAGDVVAVAAFNSDEYIELLLAVMHIGAIFAPLNHRWSFEEATSALKLAQPTALAVDENCSSWALKLRNCSTLPTLNLFLFLGDPSPGIISTGSFLTIDSIKRSSEGRLATREPAWAPRDVALICFTSGTTGRPKGVAISHTSLIIQSLAKIAIVGYGEDDVYLHMAPLCHIGGISSCMAVLVAGGCHVVIPKFDVRLAFDAIREHRVTSFITVPAIMADLISYARNENRCNGATTVRKILNGGGGLSGELVNGASQVFPRATIFSAYGMTEACSSLTFMTLYKPKLRESDDELSSNLEVLSDNLHDRRPEGVFVGKPAPHVEIKIGGCRDIENDSLSSGKILTRGLHLMVGYWIGNNAIEFESVGCGWLETGDIGRMDENGDLWLMGREKGRIKTGGENVYPEEVESILSQHPGIAKAVVIGIPDVRLTERVIACVSIKDEWNWIDHNFNPSGKERELFAEILQEYCRQRNLSRFKIPKNFILWRKPFPVTTTGKIRRDDLKREILSCMQLPSNL